MHCARHCDDRFLQWYVSVSIPGIWSEKFRSLRAGPSQATGCAHCGGVAGRRAVDECRGIAAAVQTTSGGWTFDHPTSPPRTSILKYLLCVLVHFPLGCALDWLIYPLANGVFALVCAAFGCKHFSYLAENYVQVSQTCIAIRTPLHKSSLPYRSIVATIILSESRTQPHPCQTDVAVALHHHGKCCLILAVH